MRPSFATCLPLAVLLSPLTSGCESHTRTDLDAWAPDAPHTSAPDAAAIPDAAATDAARADGGPPVGGCFEGEVTIWTSSAAPSERAHAEVLAAAGDEHGWLVVVRGLHDGDALVTLDRAGSVQNVQPIDLLGARAHAFVQGGALYLFAGSRVQRHDVDATGIVTSHLDAYVGGLALRNEGVVAVQELSGDAGFRALTLHYDEAGAAWRLRVSELRPSASEPSGLVQVSGTLAPIEGLAPEHAQLFLMDDHVWALVRGAELRVMNVQLGLGSFGAGGGAETVPARVWSDEVWSMPPEQILALTADWLHAFTARVDPVSSEYRGRLEPLPLSGADPIDFSDHVSLGYGTLTAQLRETEGRLVVANAPALEVRTRYEGALLTSASFAGTPNTPLGLAERREGIEAEVAVAFVEDGSEERRVGLRCVALPR